VGALVGHVPAKNEPSWLVIHLVVIRRQLAPQVPGRSSVQAVAVKPGAVNRDRPSAASGLGSPSGRHRTLVMY